MIILANMSQRKNVAAASHLWYNFATLYTLEFTSGIAGALGILAFTTSMTFL